MTPNNQSLSLAPESAPPKPFPQKDSGQGLGLPESRTLNALLSFNVDKHFSNVVDGLAFLDLTRSSSPMIKRVMGCEGYRRFQAFHRARPVYHQQFKKAG